METSDSMRQNVKVVEMQLKRYNARDLDGFCRCYHPDVNVEWIVSKRKIIDGLSQFRDRYSQLFASSPMLHCEIRSRVVLSDTVIDEEFVVGIDGVGNGLHTVAIYGFKEGLIDRVWFVR